MPAAICSSSGITSGAVNSRRAREHFEERKAIGPLEQEQAIFVGDFERFDPEQVLMFERAKGFHLPFEPREKLPIGHMLRMKRDEPHVAAAFITRLKFRPHIGFPQRTQNLVASCDHSAWLKGRMRGGHPWLFRDAAGPRPFDRRACGGGAGTARNLLDALLDFLAERRRRLRALLRGFRQHPAKQRFDGRRQMRQLLERRRLRELLAHHLRHRAGERRLPGEHVPERHAERIDVRAHVDFLFLELLRAGEVRRADEAAHAERGRRPRRRGAGQDFGEAEVDDLGARVRRPRCTSMRFAGLMSRWTSPCCCAALSARATCAVMRSATSGRSGPWRLMSASTRLAVDELHRVKIRVALGAEMKDRGDVPMPQLGRGARLADEALPRHLAVQDSVALMTFSATGMRRLVSNAL